MVPSPLINIGWGVERASFYREAPSYGGGSHNYGFPWGTPVPILVQLTNAGPKSLKVN